MYLLNLKFACVLFGTKLYIKSFWKYITRESFTIEFSLNEMSFIFDNQTSFYLTLFLKQIRNTIVGIPLA